MHRFLSPVCLVLLFAVLAVSSASIAQERQWGVNRSIDKISESVYHFGSANILPHIVRERCQSTVSRFTFDHSMEILLGGVTVKLLYFGPSHSDNLIQVHVPDEKVMIAVDMAKGRSLFPDYRDMDVHSILRVLKILGNLGDVDLVLPGHGPVSDQ